EMINTAAPFALKPQEPGGFQYLKVPRRGRPAVFEHPRNLARRHRTAFEIDRHQDPPPSGMSECREYGLVSIHRRFRIKMRHAIQYLAYTLNKCQADFYNNTKLTR